MRRDVYETEEVTSYTVRTSPALVGLRLLVAQGLFFIAGLVLISLAAFVNGVLRGQSPPLLSPGGIVVLLALADLGIVGYFLWDWWNTAYVIRPGEVSVKRVRLPKSETIYKPDTNRVVAVERSPWGKLYDYGTVRFSSTIPAKQVCLFNIPSPEVYAEMIRRGGAERHDEMPINE